MQAYVLIARSVRRLTIALAIALAPAAFAFPQAVAQNKACALATPDELHSLLGTEVAGLKGSTPMPSVDICMGQTPSARLMLRLAKKRATGGDAGDAAAKGVEIAKKMGAQVDVKTFGPITCSTMIPPPNLAQYGFNTTCSVSKAGAVAAIEITAKAQKDMVPIDKLHPLAEKIAQRF